MKSLLLAGLAAAIAIPLLATPQDAAASGAQVCVRNSAAVVARYVVSFFGGDRHEGTFAVGQKRCFDIPEPRTVWADQTSFDVYLDEQASNDFSPCRFERQRSTSSVVYILKGTLLDLHCEKKVAPPGVPGSLFN